jgi:TatD DNase family protein
MVDTHAHLDFKEFDKDREETIERAFLSGVKKIINVGCDLKTSKNSIELSNHYENIFAAIGIHPGEISEQETINKEQRTENREQIINELRELAGNKKVVAIGEIGLDYKENSQLTIHNLQKEILKTQIELARELNLPIIFHCRMAHSDLLEILNMQHKLQGVIHCFTGNLKQAEEYLEMGFYLGFGGIIFKMNLDEIIKKIPLDRILIETDCPFLTPLPRQSSERTEADGQSEIKTNRNEPAFVKYTAQKIAKIKKMSFQEIKKATTQNAEKLFGV